MKKVGKVLEPAGTFTTMLAVPAVVAFVESKTFAGSALVIVTGKPPGGATAARLPFVAACRSLPTVAAPMLMPGAVTVAVICRSVVGVLKPGGGSALSVVTPVLLGSNAVVFDDSPPTNVSGL